MPPDTPSAGRYMPRLIAWEITRSCHLACRHCRADATRGPYEGELATRECLDLLDNIASFSRPIIILTGGEPMNRPDVFEIASHATGLGLRTVLATCGAMIDEASAGRIAESGIKMISISLDGADAAGHDAFRGVIGAFEASLKGLHAAQQAGLGVQINTTVTSDNVEKLDAILDLAVSLGAETFNPFLLVPTGRASNLADRTISPQQYERTLRWLAKQQARGDIRIRVTCAPHYQRIIRQMGLLDEDGRSAKGCMGGQSFAFISHRGIVQICGFLEVPAGDLRANGLDFGNIWETSDLFRKMRTGECYRGRCGRCEYAPLCGGCRARAYAETGDYLAEEPLCAYRPKGQVETGPGGDELDRKILSVIQSNFPVQPRPFDALAQTLGASPDELIGRTRRMCDDGLIRRIGPIFDSRRLGYVTTLVAARIPEEKLASIAAVVSELPSVTHNYRREHDYNLWFTLVCESEKAITDTIERLRRRTGIDDIHELRAQAVYKIRVDFPMSGDDLEGKTKTPLPGKAQTAGEPMDDGQKELVRLLQDGLNVSERPFEEIASRGDWEVDRIIVRVRDWMSSGVIRRFGAVVNHLRLGFLANGMVVFRVAAKSLDRAGCKLAQRREVSHCYARRTMADFDYNLYAMVHGKSRDEVRRVASDLADQIAAPDGWEVLFSTEEYKKSPRRYFT